MIKLTAVLIDSTEPDWVQRLKFRDVAPTVTALHVGDAWLTTDAPYTVIVERKAAGDLVNSVIDGGLLNQAARMVAESMFQWRYLIYTQPEIRSGAVVLQGRPTQMAWRRVAGVLVDLQEMGVTCVPIGADSEYGATLEWLATRNHGDVRVVLHRRLGTLETPQEHLLSALPGIKGGKAEAILDVIEPAALAIEWLTDLGSQFKVRGIGSKTKESVRKLLGIPDDEMLRLINVGMAHASHQIDFDGAPHIWCDDEGMAALGVLLGDAQPDNEPLKELLKGKSNE
jgi:ERCC4-type nuclease